MHTISLTTCITFYILDDTQCDEAWLQIKAITVTGIQTGSTPELISAMNGAFLMQTNKQTRQFQHLRYIQSRRRIMVEIGASEASGTGFDSHRKL